MKVTPTFSCTVSIVIIASLSSYSRCFPVPVVHRDGSSAPGTADPAEAFPSQNLSSAHERDLHHEEWSPDTWNSLQLILDAEIEHHQQQHSSQQPAVMTSEPARIAQESLPSSNHPGQQIQRIDHRNTHIPIEEHNRIVANLKNEIAGRDKFHGAIYNLHLDSEVKAATWMSHAVDLNKHNKSLEEKLKSLREHNEYLERKHKDLQQTHEAMSKSKRLKTKSRERQSSQEQDTSNDKVHEVAYKQLKFEHQLLQDRHKESQQALQDHKQHNYMLTTSNVLLRDALEAAREAQSAASIHSLSSSQISDAPTTSTSIRHESGIQRRRPLYPELSPFQK